MTAETAVPWNEWRFVPTGARPAAFNMACDEWLMGACRRNPGTAFVRAYRWHPPAFTVGYSQRAGTELDLDACRRDGYDVVRRPTGGRVVLHRDEIAYTFACADPGLPGRNALNRYFGTVLVEVLAALGCRAELVESGAPPRFMKNVPSACFTHASQCEVTVGGRKIMGRSLREKGGVRLEQGFLLLGDGYRDLPRYLKPGPDGRPAVTGDDIGRNAVSLREATGNDVPQERALAAFRNAVGAALPRTGGAYALTDDDLEGIGGLVTDRFGNPAWNERRV